MRYLIRGEVLVMDYSGKRAYICSKPVEIDISARSYRCIIKKTKFVTCKNRKAEFHREFIANFDKRLIIETI